MSFNNKKSKINVLNFFGLWALFGCQVSPDWAPSKISAQFPAKQAPLPTAPVPPANYPATYPVAAPRQLSFEELERRVSEGIPVASLQPNSQALSLSDSRPSWQEPVRVTPTVAAVPQVPVISAPSVRIPVTSTPASRQPAPSFGTKGTVRLVNGLAVAPPDAPAVVQRAVAAGNRLQKLPYKWGGGHAKLDDDGYDCSGTVSYVLRESGLLKDQMTSRGLLKYGDAGKGEWITVWARDGHAFMTVGGLRLDTGGSSTRTGPRWKTKSRSYKGLTARHPRGL